MVRVNFLDPGFRWGDDFKHQRAESNKQLNHCTLLFRARLTAS